MKLLILLSLLNANVYADGSMFDNTDFEKIYNARIKQQNENNDFDFRLVDQYGTASSLSDHYDNKEVILMSFNPECNAEEILKQGENLSASKKKKGKSANIFYINSDLSTLREDLINKFPKKNIYLDENQQISLSLKMEKAGDYAILDVKTQKIIKNGNVLIQNSKNLNSPACNNNYVNYTPNSFQKIILPALSHSCLKCHSDKSLSYFQDFKNIQSWKQMMLRTIRLKRMPPGADPYYSKLESETTSKDILNITKWLEAGAPLEAGAEEALLNFRKTVKSTRQNFFNEIIGEKITLFSTEPEIIQATGGDFYKQYLTDKPTPNDYYFTIFNVSINPSVAHHLALHYRDRPFPKVDLNGSPIDKNSGSMQLYGNNPEPISGTHNEKAIKGYKFKDPNIIHLARTSGFQRSPKNTTYFIPKGSYLNFEIHYNPSGKTETSINELTIYNTEKSKILPHIQRISMTPNNGVIIAKAGEKNSVVTMSYVTKSPMGLIGYGMHSHYRAKSGKLFVQMPGEKMRRLIFNFPTYQYKIQLASNLETPLPLPTGTVITNEIYYDNSPENLSNPNPKKAIKIGTSVMEDENYLPRILYMDL